jgi:hypothetical protein
MLLQANYPDHGGFMNITEIVAQLDFEISRLEQAKAILAGVSPAVIKRKPGRAASATTTAIAVAPAARRAPIRVKRRPLSDDARAKIAAAQKKRWAKAKRVTKKAARATTPVTIKATAKRAPSTAKRVAVAKKPIPPKRLGAARKTATKNIPASRKAVPVTTPAAAPIS